MSEKDKVEILEMLKGLPEDKKQFVLGYAAGLVAKSGDTEKNSKSKDGEQHEQH